MPTPLRLVAPTLLVLLLGACAVGGPEVTYLADRSYPPSAAVERLRALPDRPHVVLATLRLVATELTRREVEDVLAERARSLGANAIVFGGAAETAVSSGGDTQQYVATHRYDAMAVRYVGP